MFPRSRWEAVWEPGSGVMGALSGAWRGVVCGERGTGGLCGVWELSLRVVTLLSLLQGPPGLTGAVGHPGLPGVVVSVEGLWAWGHSGGPGQDPSSPCLYPTGPSGTEGFQGVPGEYMLHPRLLTHLSFGRP